MIPQLETPRLILRAPVLADFPAHAAIWADPQSTRYFEGYIFSEEDIWLRFQRNMGNWMMFGFGFWAVEDKASGRYIGALGFFHAKREIDVPFADLPEAGWVIAPDSHGQGLANEAMAAAVAWADVHIDAPQSWCMINAANVASQKVAARAGYRPAQDGTYHGKPMLTFLRPRSGT
jgi:RimJ/RimL family protein N-acetyltransferase